MVMMESKDEEQPVYETERIVKMWEPLKFRWNEKFQFFPKSRLFRIGNRLIRELVYLIFIPVNRLVFGLRVTGRENLKKVQKTGVVTVCNHVHLLDCVILACAMRKRPVCFPTLQANFQIPVLRHLIRLLGGVPIPENKKGFLKLSRELNQYVRKGGLVHLYPETVLHPYYNGIRGFKRGAFLLAYETGAPILPFVITFRRPKGIRKYLKKKPCVTLHILEPVYPDLTANKKEETNRLMWEVYERMKHVT
ncbi:lysophospholipid acyltransferase family protein [Anaerolentibacter hominis]|uniref:lysophospholipid acyltransferase family protein n=1 Tax=Anaerolentibacter hominis TaxID=3079009 RepID=UPI0031B859DD